MGLAEPCEFEFVGESTSESCVLTGEHEPLAEDVRMVGNGNRRRVVNRDQQCRFGLAVSPLQQPFDALRGTFRPVFPDDAPGIEAGRADRSAAALVICVHRHSNAAEAPLDAQNPVVERIRNELEGECRGGHNTPLRPAATIGAGTREWVRGNMVAAAYSRTSSAKQWSCADPADENCCAEPVLVHLRWPTDHAWGE